MVAVPQMHADQPMPERYCLQHNGPAQRVRCSNYHSHMRTADLGSGTARGSRTRPTWLMEHNRLHRRPHASRRR